MAKETEGDINVLVLVKGQERYAYHYHDSQRADVLRILGKHASRNDLNFTWYDAAVLSGKIREQGQARNPCNRCF